MPLDVPREVRERLESHSNVVGTTVGPKRVDDRPTDEECLVVLVSRKLPRAQLGYGEAIPETVDVDGETVRTDVQEVGDVALQAVRTPAVRQTQRRQDRWRPAPAGVSAGHPAVSAGTLGSPPLRTADGERVVLTNAHVAAPVADAAAGDPFLQPGPADGGGPEDRIGDLLEWSEIARDRPNETDSALVAVDEGTVREDVLDVGRLAGFEEPTRDATFTKSGRTTGVTTGDLRGRDTRIRVRGYHDEPTVFEGVDTFGPMSAAGDSGSLIGVEREDGFHATDLLFAGSDRVTFGIPLSAVQDEHGTLRPAGSRGREDGGGSSDDGDRRRNEASNSLLNRLLDLLATVLP
jgi:hypothetical protein